MRRFRLHLAALIFGATSLASFTSATADMKGDASPDRHGPVDMTGLFLGIGVGASFGESSVDFNGVSRFTNDVGASTDDPLLSIHAGYQRQIRGIVVGLEVSYAANGPSGSARDPEIPLIIGVQQARVDVSDLLNVNGRIGLTNGSVHAYFTGGFSTGEVKGIYEGVSGAFVGRRIQDSQRHSGWNYGFGVEVALTRNILLGFEAMRVDLGEELHEGNNNFGQPPATLRHKVDAEFDVVKARLSYKFNP